MSDAAETSNGMPEIHSFAGLLFDLDGTIIDSTDAIVKHWHKSALLSVAKSPDPDELKIQTGKGNGRRSHRHPSNRSRSKIDRYSEVV